MRSDTSSTRGNVPLWIIQVLVALVFLGTGGMKLVLSSAALAAQSPVPLAILRILGVLEILGALGLVLPGLFKIRRGLTPIAAAGLFTVSSGATGATLAMGQTTMAVLPAILGVLTAIIAAGRRSWLAAEVEPSSIQNAPTHTGHAHADAA